MSGLSSATAARALALALPAAPTVETTDEEARSQVGELRLDKETLKKGSALYRHHCLYCHGLDGDGRGPTGPWVSPPPRDYRPGVFKFISTDINQRGARK